MSIHYRMSPSSMSRIVECPGSAQEGLPDRGSEAADLGTQDHERAAAILRGEPFQTEYDEVRAAAVDQCVEYVRGIPADETFIEYHFEPGLIPEFGGTCDAVLVKKRELIHCVDFKFGSYPVSGKRNAQLQSYLVLARSVFGRCEEYAGTIVQPFVSSPDYDSYTNDDLDKFEERIRFAQAHPNTFVAGRHCEWCPLLGTCDTARLHALEVAKTSFEPEERTVEECLQILEYQDIVAKLAVLAKTQLHSILLQGGDVPGWRLAQSLGNREWVDEDKVLKDLGNLPYSDLYETKLKSPAKLEKIVGKSAVAPLCRRPERGIVIVEESSKLPTYDPVPFGDLET